MSAPDRAFSELLHQARAGDGAAWEQIFARLAQDDEEGGKLLAMARRILPEHDRLRDLVESRDLLQSALRSGWIDVAQFRGESEGELFAWMRQILRRKVSRVVRRHDPRPVGDAFATDDLPDEDDDGPLEDIVRDEVRSRVRAAIAQLPEDQRAVMELKLQGLAAPEIARLLSIKPDAVRKRESRAAEKLRQMLE